jgi:hypothetical protein
MLSLLVFIDKDDGDKTTITLEDGSHIALEKGVAFRNFKHPPLVKSVYYTSKKNNDLLIAS